MNEAEWLAFLDSTLRSLDFDRIFASVVYEVAGEALERHHVDAITEDELEWLVSGVRTRVHLPAIGQIRRELGLSSLSRARYRKGLY